MASTVLFQKGAASFIGASTQSITHRRVAACQRPCLPAFASQRNTYKSISGKPLRTSFLVAPQVLYREQARHVQRLPPSPRNKGIRAESADSSGFPELSETAPETPQTTPPVAKLAATVAGAALTLGQAMKRQWWGEDGAKAKRIALSFAFAALPIVLGGVLGVPSAIAAPAAGSRYQRNQTSRGIMYFAMTLLVSVKQVGPSYLSAVFGTAICRFYFGYK
jgi:hypothetical protein